MSFWQILVVIGIIVIPLVLSIWMTLWTVEKRGRGPKPVYRQGQPPAAAPPAEETDKPAGQAPPQG